MLPLGFLFQQHGVKRCINLFCLILQGSKFLKNMTKLISLSSPVMSMDLNKTTEWLQYTYNLSIVNMKFPGTKET